jgi:hypothetical protein
MNNFRDVIETLDESSVVSTVEVSRSSLPESVEPTCVICTLEFTDSDVLVRGDACQGDHWHHKLCLESWFSIKRECPSCKAPCGLQLGTQPTGVMITYQDPRSLPGFNQCNTLVIQFEFPAGLEHSGHQAAAYLPNNEHGQQVLQGVSLAFRLRHMFQLVDGRIITGTVSLKTHVLDYPDQGYLNRAWDQLLDLNIPNMELCLVV